jgi:hypothetical protein
VSYHYQAKTNAEIEQTATAILARFPNRRLGLAVDIEGILEDLGLDLLPRRGIRPHAEGYLARDPRPLIPSNIQRLTANQQQEYFYAF